MKKVGDLLIGNYYKPMFSKRYFIRIGFGLGKLNFIKEKFRTPIECHEFITKWCNDFIVKISFER